MKKIQAHSNIEKAAAKVVEAKDTAVLAKKGLQLKHLISAKLYQNGKRCTTEGIRNDVMYR